MGLGMLLGSQMDGLQHVRKNGWLWLGESDLGKGKAIKDGWMVAGGAAKMLELWV